MRRSVEATKTVPKVTRTARPRLRDPYDREVGLRIRTLRISRRMSQTDLGTRLGVTFQQVQKYENGVNRVSAGRLRRVAEIFAVPLTSFFAPAKPSDETSNEAFVYLRVTGAVQLLQAFASIPDALTRGAFVKLAERLARTS
jgi:transcriptional regulator with XRE-family HTH domain